MNSIVNKVIKTILFAIPAISMVVVSDMYFPFITGKSFLFRVAVELVFCLYIGLAFVDCSYRPKWNNLMKAFAVFVGVILISDVFAVNQTKAIFSNFERMEGFILIAHLFAYYLVLVSVLKEKKDWVIMLFSSVSISVFMTFFAFLQFFGGATINQGGLRLDGTLGNSAYMATYMVFHIFFLLYLWVSNGNKVKGIGDSVLVGSLIYVVYYLSYLAMDELPFSRAGGVILSLAILTCVKIYWYRFTSVLAKFEKLFSAVLYAWIILLQLVILYYTATRGATLGLIGGLIITSLYIVFSHKDNRKVRIIAASFIGFVVVATSIFIAIRKSDFVQKSPVLNRFASISINDSTQARAIIWPIAIEAFREHPVIGWGQDNFIFAFAKYYKPEMIRHEPWFDRTHNVFLDWLVAGGIIGFLAYSSLYVFTLLQLLKSVVFSHAEKAVLIGLLAAYAFLSLFIFDNLISYYLFILLLGLTSISAHHNESKKAVEDVGGIIVVMICIFAIMCFLINYSPYKQNITLTQAISNQKEGYNKNLELIEKAINYGPTGRFESLEQMSNVTRSVISANGIPDAHKSKFGMSMISYFNLYNKDNPGDIRGIYILGAFLADAGLYNNAIPLLEQARTISPMKQQIYYSLAKAYFIKSEQEKNKDDLEQGVLYLKSAYEFAPQMTGPRDIYLNTLLTLNRLDEVRGILNTVQNPKESIDQSIVGILTQKGLLSKFNK